MIILNKISNLLTIFTSQTISINFSSLLDIIFTIVNYSNPIFLGLWFLIIISLLWTVSTKLIYLVINLSIMSLLVIALWMYTTEITIVFLVYILAFVGAVIMLFLSVILMLPSSVFIPKNQILLFIISPFSMFEEVTSYIMNNILFLLIFNFIILFTIIFSNTNIWIFLRKCLTYKRYNTFKFFKGSRPELPFSEGPFRRFRHLYAYVGYCWFIFKKVNKLNIPTNFLKLVTNISIQPKNIQTVMIWHDILYYFFINLKPKHMGVFFIFKGNYIKRSHKAIYFVFPPIPLDIQHYIPMQTKYSLFKWFPAKYKLNIIQNLFKLTYKQDRKRLNRFIFTIAFIEFIIGNSLLLLSQKIKLINCFKYLELITQLFIKISIFFIACPNIILQNNYSNIIVSKILENQDSLIAIKNILYIESPLLLIISVVGLLVALIGAAVLSRSNNK